MPFIDLDELKDSNRHPDGSENVLIEGSPEDTSVGPDGTLSGRHFVANCEAYEGGGEGAVKVFRWFWKLRLN